MIPLKYLLAIVTLLATFAQAFGESPPTLPTPSRQILEIKLPVHRAGPRINGLCSDILSRVFDPLSLKYEFVTPVSQGSEDVLVGEAAPGIRSRFPLYVGRTMAVYKKQSIPHWRGIHSLDYTRAVWLKGYNYQLSPQLSAIQFGRWDEAETQERAWFQLDMDQYDVYIDTLGDIDAFIVSHHVDGSLYGKQLLWERTSRIGFAPTPRGRALREIYDREMERLYRSGELEKLHLHWGLPFDDRHWQFSGS